MDLTAAICGDLDMVRCLAASGVDVTSEPAGVAVSRAGELGPPASAEKIVDYLTGKRLLIINFGLPT